MDQNGPSEEELKSFGSSLDSDITNLKLQGARFTFMLLLSTYYIQMIQDYNQFPAYEMDMTTFYVRTVHTIISSLTLLLAYKHDIRWVKLLSLLIWCRQMLNFLDLEDKRNMMPKDISFRYMLRNVFGSKFGTIYVCQIFQGRAIRFLVPLIAANVSNIGILLYSSAYENQEFKYSNLPAAGVLYYFFFIQICLAIVDYYGGLQWNLLLKFAYRNYLQKTEYQNVLGNLDEAIIWQKEDSIQYYNINGLNILKEHLVHQGADIECLTKLKAYYTSMHHMPGLLTKESQHDLEALILNTELFTEYKPLKSRDQKENDC